jgi:hypothetical protein
MDGHEPIRAEYCKIGARRARHEKAAVAVRWLRRAGTDVLLLVAASCSQLPPTSLVAIPPIPAGEARIWFYRDGGPYEIQATPYLRLNGRVAGISEPDGALYRDVMPGHYAVTVDSYMESYFDQFADIDLAAGQEAYVKVLSMREKVSSETGGARDIFYTRLIPADAARGDIARRPFYGSS